MPVSKRFIDHLDLPWGTSHLISNELARKDVTIPLLLLLDLISVYGRGGWTCVGGICMPEGGIGASLLSWQKPIRYFSMRSSCERITTPCRSKGTSAGRGVLFRSVGIRTLQHGLDSSASGHARQHKDRRSAGFLDSLPLRQLLLGLKACAYWRKPSPALHQGT